MRNLDLVTMGEKKELKHNRRLANHSAYGGKNPELRVELSCVRSVVKLIFKSIFDVDTFFCFIVLELAKEAFSRNFSLSFIHNSIRIRTRTLDIRSSAFSVHFIAYCHCTVCAMMKS